MINTKKDRENLYMKLDKIGLVHRLKPLLENQGYLLRTTDGKFVPRASSLGWDTPWVNVQVSPVLKCDIYHRVFYKVLDHIHTTCRNCYKVVVRPKTVVQMFDLYEMEKEMGVPCKLGLEKRTTVGALYGGYFYTQGIDAGLERWRQVRDLVDQHLSPDVDVILKRYCTEYELGGQGGVKGQGPSDQTPDTTPEEKEMEAYVESWVASEGSEDVPPPFLVADAMLGWIHYAFEHGDLTYLELTGGVPLSKPYVTYHPQPVEEEGEGENAIT